MILSRPTWRRIIIGLSHRAVLAALCGLSLIGYLGSGSPLGVEADKLSASSDVPLVDDPCGTMGSNTNGTIVPGCGGWQAANPGTTRNIRLVYDLGRQISHGIAQLDITNFEPCWNFQQLPNKGDKSDEKYHWFAGCNSDRLDHHGDVDGDMGWTVHAIPRPPQGHDCRDLKLLGFQIKGRAGQPEWYEEKFDSDHTGSHQSWSRNATYRVSVEWKPYGNYTRVILRRDGSKIDIVDTHGRTPHAYDEDDPSQPGYPESILPDSAEGCRGNCLDANGAFQLTTRYIAFGADKTQWWDCDKKGRCNNVHSTLDGPIYKNIKVWEVR